jgi:hypothetical protein
MMFLLCLNDSNRLLKNGHLLRFPCLPAGPSSLRRTAKYASLLKISGALHLALFEQPGKKDLSVAYSKRLEMAGLNSPPFDVVSGRGLKPFEFMTKIFDAPVRVELKAI